MSGGVPSESNGPAPAPAPAARRQALRLALARRLTRLRLVLDCRRFATRFGWLHPRKIELVLRVGLVVFAPVLGLLFHPAILCSTASLLLFVTPSSSIPRSPLSTTLSPFIVLSAVCVVAQSTQNLSTFSVLSSCWRLSRWMLQAISCFYYMSWMDWIAWIMIDDRIPSCAHYHIM